MRAVVVQGESDRHLALAEVDPPEPGEAGLLVRVRAFSLNRGEVARALSTMPAGFRPGSDFAGTVEAAPAGGGFVPGDRVAGLLPAGAWAEQVAATPALVAPIPDAVDFVQAAAMPVVGLAAATALDKRGDLAGRKVLVTGASGGLGLVAVQLAARAGAEVTALLRRDAHRERLTRLGARHVAVGTERARTLGRYDLIVDAVGGEVLGRVLEMLASGGVCVLVGDAGGSTTTFDADRFRYGDGGMFGGTTLYGHSLPDELTRTAFAVRLAPLLELVGEGSLDPSVAVTAPWSTVDAVARDLLDRGFAGKAVLTVDGGA